MGREGEDLSELDAVSGGSGGSGGRDAVAVCVLIMIALMALVAVVRAVVMPAFLWGLVEVGFKSYQTSIDPSYDYCLWPYRLVAVVVFLLLISYSTLLELRIRRTFADVKETIRVLLGERP